MYVSVFFILFSKYILNPIHVLSPMKNEFRLDFNNISHGVLSSFVIMNKMLYC